MNVGKLIEGRASSEIISIAIDRTVGDAVQLLAAKRIGALPVMSEGAVAGIISERDVLYRLADQGRACLDLPLAEAMTSPAITVDRSVEVDEALGLMTRRRIRHLPVMENRTMCGFISIGDLVKSRFDEVRDEAQALRSYIQTA